MKISKKDGFTLIELLVVIAIIALLTGIIITNLVGSKAKSRDAQRASDLAQIQLAIEQYFDRCDQYPPSLDTTVGGVAYGCPSNSITLGNFIAKIPTDPSGSGAPLGSSNYGYVTNSVSGSAPTDYILYTVFETSNSALSQSAPAPTSWSPQFNPSFPSGDDCANTSGPVGLGYCVRPSL